jgi:hypothetical protein
LLKTLLELGEFPPRTENIPKRSKTFLSASSGVRSAPHRKNWEVIRLESSKSFDMITRNIEQKIRETFQEVRRNEMRRNSLKSSSRPEDEEFDIWPSNVAKKLEHSRREFIMLREQVSRKHTFFENLDLRIHLTF